jgi:hypothetical protein
MYHSINRLLDYFLFFSPHTVRRFVAMLALSAVFACAQLLAAEHLAEIECDEHLCLQCQVAAEDQSTASDVLQQATCYVANLPRELSTPHWLARHDLDFRARAPPLS